MPAPRPRCGGSRSAAVLAAWAMSRLSLRYRLPVPPHAQAWPSLPRCGRPGRVAAPWRPSWCLGRAATLWGVLAAPGGILDAVGGYVGPSGQGEEVPTVLQRRLALFCCAALCWAAAASPGVAGRRSAGCPALGCLYRRSAATGRPPPVGVKKNHRRTDN